MLNIMIGRDGPVIIQLDSYHEIQGGYQTITAKRLQPPETMTSWE